MTLQEILPAVRQLPPAEKIELRRLLAEEAEALQDISPLEAGKTYYIYTPLECYGAAALMMEELERFKAENPL